MTHTIDRNLYTKLLTQTAPKIIENQAEYEKVLTEIEELLFNPNRSIEENALYDLLVMLVEKYETENYPLDVAKPYEILQHLMEARSINDSDLLNIFGSQEIITAIKKGNYPINTFQAQALADYFHVSPHLFL
ncbi:helix-turn-helix domain-containing protein [Geminocystis sp. CENA526]|uniref:helix-turn-helix domain-containing protein n=1 Tax=Geminocystis sp. CENA526 TaxID=1355871 RepID=UPI003D6FA748